MSIGFSKFPQNFSEPQNPGYCITRYNINFSFEINKCLMLSMYQYSDIKPGNPCAPMDTGDSLHSRTAQKPTFSP